MKNENCQFCPAYLIGDKTIHLSTCATWGAASAGKAEGDTFQTIYNGGDSTPFVDLKGE